MMSKTPLNTACCPGPTVSAAMYRIDEGCHSLKFQIGEGCFTNVLDQYWSTGPSATLVLTPRPEVSFASPQAMKERRSENL